MAEDDTGGEEGPKKSKIMIILLIIILLALLGGGGYYAYITFFQKPDAVEANTKNEASKDEEPSPDEENKDGQDNSNQPELGVMVPLEPFIINLANSKGNRFLKVTVTLELSSPGVHAEVNENVQKTSSIQRSRAVFDWQRVCRRCCDWCT